jgi:LmbE family N-acetylglucosaminyl deacetylase
MLRRGLQSAFLPPMPKTVFAVAAHPDDIEFVMSGTMMRLAEVGYELHYMNIANGCCGSTVTDAETTARIRREEAKQAAEFIGATFHESLTNDLEIFYDRPTLLRLSSIMRDVAPEILLIHSPQDYMEDHMNACRLAVTAAFTREMPNFPVDPPRDPVSQDVTVYHAQPHGNCDGLCQSVLPEFYIDITSTLERKAQMLAYHESQAAWLDTSQGLGSYITEMRDHCRDVGRLSRNFKYAEGWRRHYPPGYCTADADPLRNALGLSTLPSG